MMATALVQSHQGAHYQGSSRVLREANSKLGANKIENSSRVRVSNVWRGGGCQKKRVSYWSGNAQSPLIIFGGREGVER